MFNMKDIAPELEEIAAQIRAQWLAPPVEEEGEQQIDALNLKAQHGKWLVPKPKRQAPLCRAWGWELAKRVRPYGWWCDRENCPRPKGAVLKSLNDARHQAKLAKPTQAWREEIDRTYEENWKRTQEALKEHGIV